MNKKRILVTGGAGFLGSHLCEKLLLSGHQIFCLDSFLTGSKANLSSIIHDKNFSLINQDVCDPLELDIDEIYNLACPASPIHYQMDPLHTIKTSVLGTINMLELAKRSNAKIFQASTSEVYGDPQVHPQVESYWGYVNPIGIRSCYDEGKRCAETLFFDYFRQHGVRIKVARIFNSYGPRMQPNDGRVISNFIVQALKNEPITIYGNGMQTRSFCFVDDLIDSITGFMNASDDFIGPINLGNPEEFTIKELASLILKMTDSKSSLIHCALPSDDPRQRKPDISLAKEKLNWQPKISLEKGLIKTIEYFRQTLRHKNLVNT